MLAYAENINSKYNADYNIYKEGVIAQSSPTGDIGEYDDDDGGQETDSNNSSSGCNASGLNYLLALVMLYVN